MTPIKTSAVVVSSSFLGNCIVNLTSMGASYERFHFVSLFAEEAGSLRRRDFSGVTDTSVYMQMIPIFIR